MDRKNLSALRPGRGKIPLRTRLRRAGLLLLSCLAAGCSSPPEIPDEALNLPAPPQRLTPAQALQQFESESADQYRLGAGDVITVQVWELEKLSGQHVVGPDGVITLPVSGSLRVAGLSREDAAEAVKSALSQYYTNLIVTVRVDQYVSNRVLVLGRVPNPGVHQFSTLPSLMEALTRAGGLETADGQLSPTHCAIVRGSDRAAWIDLARLMESGDLRLNLRLQPNDLIFIPEWQSLPVYVLGEVGKPGPYRMIPGMSLLDALAQAGGPTEDAASSQIRLIRPGQNLHIDIALDELLEPRPESNVALERGDIVYVPRNGLAEIGYVLQKVSPLSWLFLGSSVR